MGCPGGCVAGAGTVQPTLYLSDGFTISVMTRITSAVMPRLNGYTAMIAVNDL